MDSPNKLESAIKYLSESRGLRVKDIYEALDMPRATFNAIRARASQTKKMETYFKIVDVFSMHFPDGEIPVVIEEVTTTGLQTKMIQMLERENERLRQENTKLVDELLDELRTATDERVKELLEIHEAKKKDELQKELGEIKRLLNLLSNR